MTARKAVAIVMPAGSKVFTRVVLACVSCGSTEHDGAHPVNREENLCRACGGYRRFIVPPASVSGSNPPHGEESNRSALHADGRSLSPVGSNVPTGEVRSSGPAQDGDGAADGTKGAPVARAMAGARLRELAEEVRGVVRSNGLTGDIARWVSDVADELDETAVAADELAAITARVAAQGVRHV